MGGFWGTQRGGIKEGRRVWGLAVPSNTKTLGGLSPPAPHPPQGQGQLPPGVILSSKREKPPRSRANQSREEPAGTAKAGTETLQDKVKKVTLRKLKSNNVLPPKSTGGALALGPKAGTEKWRGRGSGSARALPSHPPGRARDSKKPELELPR